MKLDELPALLDSRLAGAGMRGRGGGSDIWRAAEPRAD